MAARPDNASGGDGTTPTRGAGEGRGRLKIFLGAAPGVGKTYEMLLEGRERLEAGEDVVAGVVNPHGRGETQKLLDGFERVAPRETAKGAGAPEMDLDAVLARRPSLVLVDDLGHTNAEGARHPRRWQDVTELTGAGIDVYATLNIQHVESLNDVAAGFTHVRVRDTVPDGFVEEAEIEVVDLPPDELLRRLEEGKVHVPDETSRALGHYFSKPSLSALREMLLRHAAQAVDRRMLDQLDRAALPGTFAGGERVLVAVNELPGADMLVRAAKRLADALHAPWTAIYIETPRSHTFDETQKRWVAEYLRLAATLGATISTVPAVTVTEGLTAQIERTRATQLVIGKSRRSWWFELRHGSVVDKMMRVSEGLAVHVLPSTRTATPAPREGTRPPRPSQWGNATDYAAIVGLIALTTAAAGLAKPAIGGNAIDLVYLLPVIAASAMFGLRPGLVAALAAAVTYNFFFLVPLHTLTVADPQAAIALVVLVAIAAFTSRLTGRLKSRASLGVRSAQENAAVAGFAQTLARVSDRDATARAVCEEVARILDVDVMLLGEGKGDAPLAPLASCPTGLSLGPVDEAAAEWAWTKGEAAGAGTQTMTAADWQFLPLKTSLGTLAVMGLAREDGRDPVPADRAVLLSTLVGQAALAHERLHLEREMRDVSILKTKDRMRMSLLGAIGRGLSAPLETMTGALRIAARADPDLKPVAGALREGERLQRFLGNLVDMVGIESGARRVAPEPINLADAISGAAHDIHDRLRNARIDMRIPPRLPAVRTDAGFLNHMLVTLLANAARDGDSTITVEARRLPDAIELDVIDDGPGIAPGGEARLFEIGAAIASDDGGHALALAILKGLGDTLGIEVSAANHAGGGRVLRLAFPEEAIVKAAPGDA